MSTQKMLASKKKIGYVTLGLSTGKRMRRTWTPAEKRKIKALHAQGLTCQELADQLGRTQRGVWDWLTRVGLAINTSRWTDERDNELRALHAWGLKDVEIAAQMGRSRKTVWAHRRRLGLTPNKYTPRAPRKRGPYKYKGPAQEDVQDHWSYAQRQDQKFQEAMLAAGYKAFVDKTPGTKNPQYIKPLTHVVTQGPLRTLYKPAQSYWKWRG
jgi:hypothetical protein